jgi:hypothetical protein
VREWDLARVEGVLLRYLSEVVKTLDQTVPDGFKDDALREVAEFLRVEVRSVDSSLLDEWEERRDGTRKKRTGAVVERRSLADDPKALGVRVRREMHRLVRLLGAKDYVAARESVRTDSEVDAKGLEAAMRAFSADHGELVTGVEARHKDLTVIREMGDRRFAVTHALVDQEGPCEVAIEGEVDLTDEPGDEDAVIRVLRIG